MKFEAWYHSGDRFWVYPSTSVPVTMLEILRKTDYKDARQLIESLTAEVEKHRDGAESNDDLTMMVIHLK